MSAPEPSDPRPTTCPRCGAPLHEDQDWCLECGAPARTRLAPTPNWHIPAALLAVVVALAGAALAVAAVMTATVLERRLEAGLMLALGGESWKVAGFFLAEAALVGLAGGLAGALAGLALGRPLGGLIFGVEVPWTPVLLPLGVAAGMAIAVAGSALPVLRLFQGRPALQLRRATA
jgi:predicted lysophospholipase L1 biosynthesis ABC-type transport system permease subunit